MALIDLPLLMKDAVRGKRSAVTCQLKCASQCAFGQCNHSDNPTFRDIASGALSRRAVIGGSTAALAIGLVRQDAAVPEADKNAKSVTAITSTGLTAVRFNEIAQAMSADPALNTRIQGAAAKQQPAGAAAPKPR